MTGRGAGFCAGYGMPGYANRWGTWPAGGGVPGGRGHGWRHWYYATGMPGWARGGRGFRAGHLYPGAYEAPLATAPLADEADVLRNEAEQLESMLREVRERLAQLEAGEEA